MYTSTNLHSNTGVQKFFLMIIISSDFSYFHGIDDTLYTIAYYEKKNSFPDLRVIALILVSKDFNKNSSNDTWEAASMASLQFILTDTSV